MIYKIRLNKKVWLFIIAVISIIALVLKYTVFTSKYFTDSITILSMERNFNFTGSLAAFDGSYASAIIFYNYINFFD